MMKILFLDQSGKLGGAELCLADFAQHSNKDRPNKGSSLVGVFADGDFPDRLRHLDVPVKVLANQEIQVQKESGLLEGFKSVRRLIPLIASVARLSGGYDLVYANTQKALVVGAIAALISRRPLVYHLHDIISGDHFSAANRRIIVTLANQAALVIANSCASRDAFVLAGGRTDRLHVVYNGFQSETYADCEDMEPAEKESLRNEIVATALPSKDTGIPFIVGQFSRLSPWKGQHVLIEALQYCPDRVMALLVGDALFGEQDYVQQLHRQIKQLKLEHRVKFLGFRSDIPRLMAICDLVAHTSTAPEPFGRVIAEAMWCARPVVAAAAGGALEIVEHGQTGWLTTPGDAHALAETIMKVCDQPELAELTAKRGRAMVQQRFNIQTTNTQIDQLLRTVL